MDIPVLGDILKTELNNIKNGESINRLHDYIFICFFLGNDFMPHFPAVNIRTRGVEIMISAYKNTIGKTRTVLTDGNTIYWANVGKMLNYIAEQEEELLHQEYGIRRRLEKRKYRASSDEEKMYKFSMLPTYNREKEEE